MCLICLPTKIAGLRRTSWSCEIGLPWHRLLQQPHHVIFQLLSYSPRNRQLLSWRSVKKFLLNGNLFLQQSLAACCWQSQKLGFHIIRWPHAIGGRIFYTCCSNSSLFLSSLTSRSSSLSLSLCFGLLMWRKVLSLASKRNCLASLRAQRTCSSLFSAVLELSHARCSVLGRIKNLRLQFRGLRFGARKQV